MSKKIYIGKDNLTIPYLSEDEKEDLSIIKGTLTAHERQIVQEHVVFTAKMLDKIKFNNKFGFPIIITTTR